MSIDKRKGEWIRLRYDGPSYIVDRDKFQQRIITPWLTLYRDNRRLFHLTMKHLFEAIAKLEREERNKKDNEEYEKEKQKVNKNIDESII